MIPFHIARLSARASVRSFSSASRGLRAYPQYTLFGPDCMLSVKAIAPTFKVLKSNALVLEGNKTGRILFEWIPRDADGKGLREDIVRFALTPEEAGLTISRLPDALVSFERSGEYGLTSAGQGANKVLRMTPVEGGAVAFEMDFEVNGIGGQFPPGGHSAGPFRVVAQRGEFTVIRRLVESSIPSLIGWDSMMEIAVAAALGKARSGNQGTGGGGYNNN